MWNRIKIWPFPKLVIGAFVVSVLAFGNHTLFAQTSTQNLSLSDCVQYALANNHKIKKANLEIEKGTHQLQELKSKALPHIGLESNLHYFPQVPTNILTGAFITSTEEAIETQFGRNINFNTGLEFSQLIYRKGRKLGTLATSQLTKINQLQLTKTQEELAFEIAKLYFQAQLVEQQKGTLLANLDQINALLFLMEKQLENGFIKQIDVDQLKVKKNNLDGKLFQLNLQHDKILQVLKYQMTMPLDAPIALIDTLSEANYNLPANLIEKPEFKSLTVVSLLQTQSAINNLQMQNIRADYYPNVYLKGAYNLQAIADGFSDFGQSGTWFHYGYFGLQLLQPIFDGHKKKAQIAQKEIEIQQIKEEQAFVEASLELQYNNAKQAIEINLKQLESLDEYRKVAETVYNVAQTRYSQGIAPITELLSAETARQEAQTNYLAALLQLKIAELELQYAKGTLLKTLLQ